MKNNEILLLPNPIRKQITVLSEDNVHGSTFLTEKAISIVKSYIKDSNLSVSDIETLKKILFFIVQSQPTMALLFTFSNKLLFLLDDLNEKKIPLSKQKESIEIFLKSYSQLIKNGKKQISQNLVTHLSPRLKIATYSSSGTIQHAFETLAMHNDELTIYCSESRPKNEGVILAESLSKKGITVYLMTDASLFSKIQDFDYLVIGADSITQQGVINKMGSYPLAQLATQHSVPVYCLSHSLKIIPYQYSLQDEPKKPDKDILAEKQENIAVINYYFDTTPLNLFNGIITEKGFFQPVDIKEYIQKQSLHPFLKRNDS